MLGLILVAGMIAVYDFNSLSGSATASFNLKLETRLRHVEVSQSLRQPDTRNIRPSLSPLPFHKIRSTLATR